MKSWKPGAFKKEMGGISAHYTEESHKAESAAACRALAEEFPEHRHLPTEGEDTKGKGLVFLKRGGVD